MNEPEVEKGAAQRLLAAMSGLFVAALPLSPALPQAENDQRYQASIARNVPAATMTPRPTHPLMTPEAIGAAAANFNQCLASLWPPAAHRGVSRRTFEAATRGLAPDLKIMELLDKQPEFERAIWDYVDDLVNDNRVATGRIAVAQNKQVFDTVEKTYGVDRYVLAAIWGIESNFGTEGGERPVVQSTATLACIGRRQNYFREEFLSTLEILEHGDVPAERLKGSWAGAFGPTQFMPTSFKRYAVDFDGDGRKNVVDSIPDLLASTANNLKRDGWHAGASWGYEVVVPPNFNFALADRSVHKTIREWEALGIRRAGGKPFPRPSDAASLMLPAGARGPAFLTVENFRVIMKYNPAEAYALAIGHLADRIRGGAPFVQPWPRDEGVLSRNDRFELQERLAVLGYNVGDNDGNLGPRTRAALRDFQARTGLVPDGFASGRLLEALRSAR